MNIFDECRIGFGYFPISRFTTEVARRSHGEMYKYGNERLILAAHVCNLPDKGRVRDGTCR